MLPSYFDKEILWSGQLVSDGKAAGGAPCVCKVASRCSSKKYLRDLVWVGGFAAYMESVLHLFFALCIVGLSPSLT